MILNVSSMKDLETFPRVASSSKSGNVFLASPRLYTHEFRDFVPRSPYGNFGVSSACSSKERGFEVLTTVRATMGVGQHCGRTYTTKERSRFRL